METKLVPDLVKRKAGRPRGAKSLIKTRVFKHKSKIIGIKLSELNRFFRPDTTIPIDAVFLSFLFNGPDIVCLEDIFEKYNAIQQFNLINPSQINKVDIQPVTLTP